MPSATLTAALACANGGDLREARALIDRVLAGHPADANALAVSAFVAMKEGDAEAP